MTGFDRRQLIALSAAYGSLFLLACKTTHQVSRLKTDVTAPTAPRVRRRWEPGKPLEFKSQFAEAVAWLKANDEQEFPEDDIRHNLSWKRFVDIHNSSCPHGNWLFVPWHRLYLYYFETACQIALNDPHFALPYWDWTLDPVIPDEFFTQPALKLDGRHAKQGDAIPPEFVGQDVMNRIYANNDFYSFFSRPTDYRPPFRGPAGTGGSAIGTFEAIPHNNVHRFIGGSMASNESPNDPIFWLHHGNVDRIWRQFQRLYPNAAPGKIFQILRGGSEIASRDDVADVYAATALEFQRHGNAVQPLVWSEQSRRIEMNLTIKNVQDIQNFGYVYDTDSLPPPVIPESEVPKDKVADAPIQLPRGIVSRVVVKGKARYSYGLIGSSQAAGDRATTIIDVSDAESKKVLGTFQLSADARASFSAAHLVPPPQNQREMDDLTIRFFAFVDDSFKSFDFFHEDAYKKPEYVGVYSFFGADHHRDHAQNVLMDFSTSLRKLLPSTEIKTITLMAVAMNMRNRKAIAYFSTSSQTELALQFESIRVR